MIRVGLLDTTVPNSLGSMSRYREQLSRALLDYSCSDVDVSTVCLSCDESTLDRTPSRLQMWRRHYHVWRQARTLDVSNFDVLHLLDGSFGYVADAISAKMVVTVHDLIPRMQMEGDFQGAPPIGHGARWIINRCLRGVRQATVACTVSQSTADDLHRFSRGRCRSIEVVPMAIEPELFAEPNVTDHAPDADTLDLDGPFLLHLGNNGFYKNRIGAIEIFKKLDPSLNAYLVLAGPSPDDSLRRACDESGLRNRIVFVANPDQQLLVKLYQTASIFLFPSLYEGFGWPPLEAMSAGCPVVCSDAGSIPEVVGSAGVVAKSKDYAAMTRGCERILHDESFRKQTIAAGHQRVKIFSRKHLAERMVSVYQSVCV